MSAVIQEEALRDLIELWLNAGKQIAAPVRCGRKLLYQRISAPEQAVFDPGARPSNSAKEFLFPRHEPLFGYRLQGRQVELTERPAASAPQILLGVRPCDAAALPILDHVFNWDYRDESYNRRRERTTVVSLACALHDPACFCTSVGSGPADETGSDAMLLALGDGNFEVRILTDKGRKLLAGNLQTQDTAAPPPTPPPQKFDPSAIRQFLARGFDSPLWARETLACLGCGICAHTCPTCHCFDIVDEGNAAGGARVRNWDTCQFPLFTQHASGHNPRAAQGQRQRQRILHKFSIYPEKFGPILCTGCGNCARNCPAGLGVLRVLEAIGREESK